jgi:hypothetical protein
VSEAGGKELSLLFKSNPSKASHPESPVKGWLQGEREGRKVAGGARVWETQVLVFFSFALLVRPIILTVV